MRNEQRAYKREREQWPRGNRLSVVPMDAGNLGRENDFRDLKQQPKKEQKK